MNKPVVGAQLNFNQTAAAHRFANRRLAVGAGVSFVLQYCGPSMLLWAANSHSKTIAQAPDCLG